MDGSNVSILQLLKEKSNILNRKCQEFQIKIKNVMNEMMESQINNENKSKFKNKINELLDDYSLSINRLEIQYLTKCENYLQHQIKPEIDNESSKSNNTERSKPCKREQYNTSCSVSSSLSRHNEEYNNNSPKCDICGKHFATNARLKDHKIQVHTEEKPYICSECNKAFKIERFLFVHIRNAHNGYPYPCKLNGCHQKFKYHSELKAHQNSVHILNTNKDNDDNNDNDDDDIDLEIENISTNEIKNDAHCNLCNKNFMTSTRLKEHELTVHSDERPYECSQCDKTFKLKRFLFAHIRDNHDGNPFHCTFTGCNEKFKYHAELAQHKRSKHKQSDLLNVATITTTNGDETELNEEIEDKINNNPFVCNYNDCNKSFKLRKTYYWHIRNAHNGYPLECTQCHQKFKYKVDLNKHQNSVHAKNNNVNPRKKRKLNENENELFINNNNNSMQQIEKEANPTYHNNSNKKKSGSNIDDASEHNNNNSIKSTPYSQQQRRNKRRLYISDTDSDTESDDDDNNNMNTSKTSNKILFDSDNDMDMDDMNSNNKEKPFECNICFKAFKNSAGLGGHLSHCRNRNNINGEKQDKSIYNKSPYKCDECDDEFNIQNNLFQHKKWIHNQSIVSISSTPSNASDTSQNKSPNKSFECDVCHKKLVSLKGLKEHKLLHSDKRPYKCSLCLKDFTLQKYLNQHIINIHNENPWECDQCKERFRKKYDMLTHKKLTHQSNSEENNMNMNTNNSKEELNESENEELKLLHDIPDLEEDDDTDKIEINSNSDHCNDKPLIETRTKSLFNHRL